MTHGFWTRIVAIWGRTLNSQRRGARRLARPPALECRCLLTGFQLNVNRWTQTVTNGSGLSQGDPTTLTWSIADDGTTIPGFNGEPEAPSDLIAFLDRVRGAGPGGSDLTQRPWFSLFTAAFSRLSELSGLTYVYEPNDDGVAFSNFPVVNSGTLGVRGDVRIGGHYIDGESKSDTLAYNFSPNGGEMVIDTGNPKFFGTQLFGSTTGFRDVIMHEHGHGIGLDHVESPDSKLLMEPTIDSSIDGPQLYDILTIQRGYGDALEKSGGNDSAVRATSLGSIASGASVSRGTLGDSVTVSATATDFLSIDDETDVDFFSFTVPANAGVTATLTPRGASFQVGPVDGPSESVNTKAWGDLQLRIYAADGTTLLQTSNTTGLGGIESLTQGFSSAGTYFVAVSSLTPEVIQLYGLSLSVVVNRPPTFSNRTLSSLQENSPNGTVAGTVTGTDPDSGQTLTYTITGGNTGGAFAIDAVTGRITVANLAALDYETTPSFQLTVAATDNGLPNTSKSAQITIGLTNVDESPVTQSSSTVSSAENVTAVTRIQASDPEGAVLSFQIVGGSDANLFQIDSSTGALSFQTPPNFESPTDANHDNQYEVTVQISDGTSSPILLPMIVTVTNVNEAPSLTGLTKFQFEEFSPRWTIVGRLQAIDPEGDSFTFSIIEGNPDESLKLGADGTLWVYQQDLTGLRHRGSFSLTIRVTDSSPASLTSTSTVDVYILPVPVKNNSFSPAVDGTIFDGGGNGFGDGDTVDTTSSSMLVQGGSTPSRTVLEFDLHSLPTDKVIKNVSLFFATTALVGGEIVNVPIDVYGYSGDGAITASDAMLGTLIGTRVITNTVAPNQLKVHSVSLTVDVVTAAVRSGYLGLVLRNDSTSDGVQIASSEASVLSAQKPYLLIQLSDLLPDAILEDQNSNQFLALQNQGSTFNATAVDAFPTGTWERFLTGDFNGDGRTDLIGRLTSDGSWWVSLCNASGTFQTATRWGAWSTSANWSESLVADFDNDGKDDLAGRVSYGDWWVSLSTGTALQARLWGNWSSSMTWVNTLTADFNRDGRQDIAGQNSQGMWFVSISTGTAPSNSSFTTSQWGQWSTNTVWSDIQVGDFNGDGRADIAGRSSIGQWWINRSTGASFAAALYYGLWSTNTIWSNVLAGDFDGDGRDDIVGRASNGVWWLANATVTKFSTSSFGSWGNPQSQWAETFVGDFNRDGRADLISRNSTQSQTWIALATSSGLVSSNWAQLQDSTVRAWRLLKPVRLKWT